MNVLSAIAPTLLYPLHAFFSAVRAYFISKWSSSGRRGVLIDGISGSHARNKIKQIPMRPSGRTSVRRNVTVRVLSRSLIGGVLCFIIFDDVELVDVDCRYDRLSF